MFTKPLTLNALSLKQRILHLFRVSYIIHFYRVYIKSNIISITYKYTFSRDLFRRYEDYRRTNKRYKVLKNRITFKIRLKKIQHSWQEGDYSSFLRLNLLLIFNWPIWGTKKLIDQCLSWVKT
jgi:hypothetical protein